MRSPFSVLATLLLLLGLCARARAQEPVPLPPVLHVARNETTDGRLVLAFRVRAPDAAGAIVVRYRVHGATRFSEATAHRVDGEGAWTAEIPPRDVRPPSVDYYVVSRAPGRPDAAVFASPRWPHPVVVVETDAQWHERDELRLSSGHRSRVSALGEWIDYGAWYRCDAAPCGTPQTHVDRYFHSEVSYAYGMFDVVEWLRFSVAVLRGNYGLVDTPNDVGLYTGAAEIGWYATSWLRFRTQLVLGISQTGFAGGFFGAIVIGRDGDTQLTLSGGGVGPNVGATGSLRLSWHSVPHFPMGATVEVSSMPGGDRAGVRLVVDVGWEIEPGTTLRVWGGYQARTQVIGGPAVGAELVLGI